MPENMNIAILHNALGNRDKAHDLLREMKKNSTQYGLNNHAFALYWYGVIIYPLHPDTGILYIDSAIHIWEKLPVGNVSTIYYTNTREPIALTQAYSFLVRKSLNAGNLEEAENHLKKTKYYANEEKCSYGRYLSVLADYFDTKSEWDSALFYSRQMLSYYKKPSCWCEILNSHIRSAHYKMYVFHEKLGHADSALFHFRKYMQIDRQLDKQLQARAIDLKEYQSEIQNEKRVHQQQMNEEEVKRNISVAAGLVLLILAVGFYSRWRYVRKSKARLQTEKDRSENLLHNILPAEVAAELKEKGESEARDFDEVTVLFSDFKGFTESSEKLSAKALVKEINTCFKAFDEIMQKYGIEKIKTIGDAYMAAGGLHIPKTAEPKDVVKAGIEMQQFMLLRKAEKEKAGEPFFEMRVGIHTGPVVAGIVGVKKFQYDIWGDTVNTASRMESAGEVGKANISQATYELLKNDSEFTFESRGKIKAKGKGEMEMHFVSLSFSEE
jgi:class 3 adenylate cyclase